MNICIYRQGAFLFEAELIEDTTEGMVIKYDGIEKTMKFGEDYDFKHDINIEYVGILYTNNDGRTESMLIPGRMRAEFEKTFNDIPSQSALELWLKEPGTVFDFEELNRYFKNKIQDIPQPKVKIEKIR
jgi:hypothetical protein